MSKLTKKQKKISEMMEGFTQPCSASEAIFKNYKKYLKKHANLTKQLNAICL